MITLAALKEYGADVEDGLSRCMNIEDFYLKMVNMALDKQKMDHLESALADHDLDTAFELAHSMKGVFANLALTPVLKPVEEMTELLRSRTDTDYTSLMAETKEAFNALLALQ